MEALIISQADFLISGGAIEKKDEIFEGDIGFEYKASVDFKAVKISDSQVYISGKVKGYFVLECSRCLEKYRHPFEIKINADMDFLNGLIDLGEEVRQLLSLEIPMKPLCGKDCVGICASLQDEENYTKERWKELLTGGSKYAKSKKKTHASPQR